MIINTCRPILIGKEAFLTMRSILITHNIGHSPLEGFENKFAPIVIEDRAQIGMNSILYAGIRIGKEAIIGSNSYVVNSIPEKKMALGVPAKVVHNSSRELTPLQQERITKEIIRDFQCLLSAKGYHVAPLTTMKSPGFTVTYEDRKYHLTFLRTFDDLIAIDESADEIAVLTFEVGKTMVPNNYMVFDLLKRRVYGGSGIWYETTREYLRKRGITFEPGPWRYEGGLI